MKNFIGIIGVLLIIIFGVFLFSNINSNTDKEEDSTEGRIYFSITDDTADIQSVNEIELEIDEIELYSQSSGWVTASSNSESYNLLELKAQGKTELHSEYVAEAGNYEKVKLTLGGVTIDHETNGDISAILPSEEIIIDTMVVVRGGEDSSVILDFIADQSLHTTSDGDYVFAAVIATETRSGTTVNVSDTDESVVVAGGSIDSTAMVGVDLDGSVKSNFVLDSSTGLEVDRSILSETKFMIGGKTYTKSSSQSQSSPETGDEENESNSINSSVEIESDSNINLGL